jgi:hypothetical protein
LTNSKHSCHDDIMADLPTTEKPNDPPAPATDQPPPSETDQKPAAETTPQETPPAPDASTEQPASPSDTTPAETPPTTEPAAETTTDATGTNTTEQAAAPPVPPKPPSPAKPQSKRMLFIIGGLMVVGLSALFAFFLSSGTQNKTSVTNSTASTTTKPSLNPQKDKVGESDMNNPQAYSRTLVYGSWSGQTSLIKAVELSTQKTALIASLPSSIKKVSVLNAQTLLFIDQTDKQDHGKQIVIYNIKTKSPLRSIPASDGFGIDDYVLSPDKNFVAIWEVSFAPNSQILQGGKSRVYAVDLRRPTVKNLLYDEKSTPTDPVHYPRAILNNGRVFADKFLPNDPKGGAGWAYGLSVVDLDGTNRQDLPPMKAGTYGTQPSLSPDGKYLVFSGYDGSKGDGKTVVNGYRQALLTPNTVEILDTETFTRRRFAKFENNSTYSSSEWDPSTGKIILTIVSPDTQTTGVYAYDMNTQELAKINIPATEASTYGFLTQLTSNTSIIGTKDTNASNLGNLGETYSYPFTQVALYDTASSKVSFVPLEDTFAQYITLLPGDFFKSVLGIQTSTNPIPQPTFVDLYTAQNDAKARQQLYTFIVKYDLEAIRETQQSTSTNNTIIPAALSISLPAGDSVANPNAPMKCKDLAVQQCAAQGVSESSSDYKTCVKTNKDLNKTQKGSGLCSDSPLYLYGYAGQQVHVQIQTQVSNAIPSYNDEYTVTLADNGRMAINGETYSRIAYDYLSNLRRISPPTRGAIVKKADVEKVLRSYSAKLGLNEKETTDLVNAGRAKAVSDYVFVSFFDKQTSEQILPISFNPKPDNYLNVVFYFKNLNKQPFLSPLPPIFESPVARTGLTAVEVSEITE